MSKKLFTDKEIEILSQNRYVKKVSSKGITYTDEFKRKFISENKNGKFPRRIFEECGFDIDILGVNRIESAGKRWRSAFVEMEYLNYRILEGLITEDQVKKNYHLKKNTKNFKQKLNFYRLKMNC